MKINKIAISGASGFIGTHLRRYYNDREVHVIALSRSELADVDLLEDRLVGCDAVVNLAGASIAHRWSDDYKMEVYESRVQTTHNIVEAVNRMKFPPSVLLSASAVGYYPYDGAYNEDDLQSGTDFLAYLCRAWEKEAFYAKPSVRVAVTRFGVVLSKNGGAFGQMTAGKNMGIIPRLGAGKQSIAWIDLFDLVRAIGFVLETDTLKGVFNLTSPICITANDFAQETARSLGGRRVVEVPAWMIKKIYGEASEALLRGRCVYPKRLLEAGFLFSSCRLSDFLTRTNNY